MVRAPLRSVAGTTSTGEVRPLVERSGESGGRRRQGRYVLGDLLGRGGMAEVFAGHAMGSHGFQKPVAIKRLLPELANDHLFVERLIGEAKLLVGMQHGNIVSVLDLARDGEDVFLVMEFMDGPSLRQLMRARGRAGIPIGVATYVVQSAAAGLEFAHGRHVIHADISPSNLLLTTSGEVRVADFGIARREGNGAGVVEGKWAYMAPEQARGEPLAPRSDVFALGVVLYELITGRHPLGRQCTPDERESGPMRVTPPRMIDASIPAGLDAICMKALAHDPRDRYARMQQLIDALVEERWTNGWREGASDLAAVIRECAPASTVAPTIAGPRTMVTDRPVTIVTRSLISATATPAPGEAGPTAPAPPATVARGSARSVPVQDIDSLQDTFESSAPQRALQPMAPPRNYRWTFGVLGVAALFGVSAAIAMQVAPDAMSENAETAPSTARAAVGQPAAAQPATATPAPTAMPVPVPVPIATPAPAPAPAPVEQPKQTVRKAKSTPVRKAAVADATLRIVTDDGTWAKVSVGADTQEAPGAKFHLAAGTYTVRLRNSELAISMACNVSLDAGKVKTLRVALEDKQCYGD